MAMVRSPLSGLLRVRRRGNDAPQEIEEQHTASLVLSELDKRSSISLSCYPVKAFAGLLVILSSVVLHASTLNLLLGNAREITLPEDDPASLRRVQHSVDRRYPRTVSIIINQSEPLILTMDVPYTKNFERNSIPLDSPIISSEWFEPNSLELGGYNYNLSRCEPTHAWQSKSFPNCNMFHESTVSAMRFITRGTIRSVFELSEDIDGKINKFVYKNLDYSGRHSSVTPKRVELERMDGLVLERTTRSQFIPSIHGYCSTVVLMDHAPRDMQQYNDRRLARNISVSPLDRLKISIHIASGVADLHSVYFMHNDLHEQQFLYQDGLFKLNDFNYAKPMYVEKNTNQTCALSKFKMGLFGRSLEELQRKVGYEGFSPVTPDKIDVWMMGNLLYTILTDLQVWNKRIKRYDDVKLAAAKRLVAGERPWIPRHIQNSNDPAHVAMKNALDMTWKYDSKERPSARSIANYLIGELQEITGEETPDFRINFLNAGFR